MCFIYKLHLQQYAQGNKQEANSGQPLLFSLYEADQEPSTHLAKVSLYQT